MGQVAVNSILHPQNLSAILLTHFHSDHIGDLGEALMQSWAAGRNHKINVYGPPGVEPTRTNSPPAMIAVQA